MSWFDILLIAAIYVIGIYLHITYKAYRKNQQNNDSWKNRK